MLRTKFGNNNTAVDQGFFFFFGKGRARVPVLLFFGFQRGCGGLHSQNTLFLPCFGKIFCINVDTKSVFNS